MLDAAEAMKTTNKRNSDEISSNIILHHNLVNPVTEHAAVPSQPDRHASKTCTDVSESLDGKGRSLQRRGWRDECKGLAQRLLFSEDGTETENNSDEKLQEKDITTRYALVSL